MHQRLAEIAPSCPWHSSVEAPSSEKPLSDGVGYPPPPFSAAIFRFIDGVRIRSA